MFCHVFHQIVLQTHTVFCILGWHLLIQFMPLRNSQHGAVNCTNYFVTMSYKLDLCHVYRKGFIWTQRRNMENFSYVIFNFFHWKYKGHYSWCTQWYIRNIHSVMQCSVSFIENIITATLEKTSENYYENKTTNEN